LAVIFVSDVCHSAQKGMWHFDCHTSLTESQRREDQSSINRINIQWLHQVFQIAVSILRRKVWLLLKMSDLNTTGAEQLNHCKFFSLSLCKYKKTRGSLTGILTSSYGLQQPWAPQLFLKRVLDEKVHWVAPLLDIDMLDHKIQALVYDTLPSTTAVFSYAKNLNHPTRGNFAMTTAKLPLVGWLRFLNWTELNKSPKTVR